MARGPMPGANRVSAPKQRPMPPTRGGRHGGKGRKLRRISIEPTMNGGFVAEHSYHDQGGEYQPPDQHAFSNANDLHAHLQQHIPMQQPQVESEPDEEAGE